MQLPPPTAPRFFKVDSTLQRFTIISDLHWWYAHFDERDRQPHRCGGTICSYCDAGRQPELRFVVGVSNGRAERGFIELRERHRPVLQKALEQEGGILGSVIHIAKKGDAKNSPVEVDIISRKECDAWDIRLMVESLGLRPDNP